VLCTIGASAAGWLAHALDVTARALAGAWAGVPWVGLRLGTEAPWLVAAVQGAEPPLGAGVVGLVTVSGSVALVIAALAAHFGSGLVRVSGVTRALALEAAVVALLWIPTAFAAAAWRGGGGPIGTLYARLGAPQAGRWVALPLAVVLLVLLAPVVARRALAVGRSWMRVDGLEFRRRLVRNLAGVPAATTLGTLMVVAEWAPAGWAVAWAVAMLVTLRMRTP
jgi:hypothetical protein